MTNLDHYKWDNLRVRTRALSYGYVIDVFYKPKHNDGLIFLKSLVGVDPHKEMVLWLMSEHKSHDYSDLCLEYLDDGDYAPRHAKGV